MKSILLIICFFISVNGFSQEPGSIGWDSTFKNKIVHVGTGMNITPKILQPKLNLWSKNNVIGYGFLAAAGVTDAVDNALWAYNPYKGNQFSDPYISSNNKYQGIWLRRNLLVWTTDLNHLMNFCTTVFSTVSFSVSLDDVSNLFHGKTIWYVVKKTFVGLVFNRVTHTITFGIYEAKYKH